MKTLGINIDHVLRDSYSQFDKFYRKHFIHNPNIVSMDEGFSYKEYTDEEIDEIEKKSKARELELITLPMSSYDLTNHYKFEKIKDVSGERFLTPKEACDKFVYDDYPFQIFGSAEEYDAANDTFNKIQAYGFRNKLFNTILFSSLKSSAIPATYGFLSKHHSRAKAIIFLEEDHLKWEHCDVLIDATPEAIQTKPKNKKIIKINHPFNKWDKADYSFDSIKEIYNEDFFNNIFK